MVVLCNDKVERISVSEALAKLGQPLQLSGVNHYLLYVATLMDTWEKRWNEILDIIEVENSIQMHELQDARRLDELMFDRSFEVSRRYFSMLQFLQLASKSLQKPIASFEAAHRHFTSQVTSNAQNPRGRGWTDIMSNWEKVARSVSTVTANLRSRVDQQIEQVKSHQESFPRVHTKDPQMFNATSLRETNNGMALNRSVSSGLSHFLTILLKEAIARYPAGFEQASS
ncbi:hypothetical protein BDP81DRAFT_454926 [Colletotrichum phormii]|uniref:Uncharacterized protein n=1 Tax=Colletotrichum phormii TaxID=359342 RepID=A0AAI9ZG95_9PEZI|nr:uncharacterized protein BDP81DRAFT_454926 [Colletotrichum phormii]KAK1622911.1 hypothetical protein BDP81DRAFT_454926 [Colletotrichum phormii]